jgi:protein gp37
MEKRIKGEMTIQKTAIEWVRNPNGNQGYSWNPIKGTCPIGCWYCYGKKIYKRFKLNPNPRIDERSFFDDIVSMMSLNPRGIFVCSTFELFHPITLSPCPWYPKITWRDAIFHEIKKQDQHRFYILTKLPQNIDRPMPRNVWLGTTITGLPADKLTSSLRQVQVKIKFVSFEPLLKPMVFFFDSDWWGIDWFVIGRLTGHGHKYDPKREWIEDIIKNSKRLSIPIFIKNNLIPILGEQFVKANQKFPKEQP